MDDTNQSQISNLKTQNDNSSGSSGSVQSGGTLVEFPHSASHSTVSSDRIGSGISTPAQQPIQPTGQAPQKEAEPLPSVQNNEWIAPSEQSPELEPEVIEAGVKETGNNPKLSVEDKIAGIQEAMESTPVQAAPKKRIHYPITAEEAEKATKGPLIKLDPSKAINWLAMLIIRQLKMRRREE